MSDFAAQDFGSPDYDIESIISELRSIVFINTAMKNQVQQRSETKNHVTIH